MIDGLKPYPKYKDSGVPWLAEVPEHWEVVRNGRLFAERREVGFPELPVLEVSLRTGVRVRSGDSNARKQALGDLSVYKCARAGDIAYNMMRMWQGAVGVAPIDGLVSPAYVVARPFPERDSRYYEYLFRTPAYMGEVNNYSRGIVADRNRLYWDEFKDVRSPMPPYDEQVLIVRFLYALDRRIGRYIGAKKKLIALLNEHKQAIVHHAVTRGVDPDVRVRASDFASLGDVSERWTIKRLKRVTRLQRGYDLPKESRRPGPYPVVSSGGIIDSHVEARSRGPGVVMGRYGSTDAIFYIESDFWPHNTALFVTDFHQNDPQWCYYMLSDISKADHSGKSAVPGVDRKDLFDILVAVPPVVEQEAIRTWLTDALRHLGRAVESAERQIALMREFRLRLVSDVTTGKLDVREAAAHPPFDDSADEFAEIGDTDELLVDEADTEMEAVDADD